MKAGLGKSFAPKCAMSKLPALYATDGDGNVLDKPLLVKWFSPYNGWRWYAAESDGKTCFGFVDGFEGEWGYFDLEEMASTKYKGIPAIERDTHFQPTTLRELMRKNETNWS